MAKKINGNAHKIDIWYKVSLNFVQLGEGLMLLVSCCKIPWMPEVFSLTSNEKRREGGVLVTLSRLRRSIPSSPKRKKISGTQGSCKSDIFKLKFDQQSFVRLKSVLPCVTIGVHLKKCTKFCQQVVYSQNDTLSGNSHITMGNKSPGDMARNFNLRY